MIFDLVKEGEPSFLATQYIGDNFWEVVKILDNYTYRNRIAITEEECGKGLIWCSMHEGKINSSTNLPRGIWIIAHSSDVATMQEKVLVDTKIKKGYRLDVNHEILVSKYISVTSGEKGQLMGNENSRNSRNN